MIVETDDYFAHQIVEPHAHVLYNDPSWADRSYISISDPDRFGMDIGVSMYPNNNAIETYAIAAIPGRQWSLRASRDLSAGRYPLWAGPSRFEIVEPMKRWTMTLDENESGISYNLEFIARGGPYEIRQPEIRKNGRLIHTDVYVFQPGLVSGTLKLDDHEFELNSVGAHRDRTWGLRAAGEGTLPHGVLAWLAADFEDFAIVAHIRDRGDDVAQVRDGAIFYPDGRTVPLVAFEHALDFDYETRQLNRAHLTLTDEDGKKYQIEVEPTLRIHLSGAGYVTDPKRRRGRQGNSLWSERWDLTDPKLVASVEGLNDNVGRVTCNGEVGTGVLETSLGEHTRYKAVPARYV
ncbi:hypothetical protein [Streptomyces arenae]|uniref:hypothetical protein n=1 Tax=Streptomyces arenae TaxID=29301 RepID=UPI00265AE9A2|nr:hypothetical protein [Streptomyces arenae]MCG7207412.1 hypothetical protein [Streptomyces arenae]